MIMQGLDTCFAVYKNIEYCLKYPIHLHFRSDNESPSSEAAANSLCGQSKHIPEAKHYLY